MMAIEELRGTAAKPGRKIMYEERLDPSFAEAVAKEPGGEGIWNCIQCGTCSAICPVSAYMDLTPRKIVGMIRAGFRDEVLSAVSPWICTSCYACTVECPEKIRITDIMYIVKQMAMREPEYHKFIVPAIQEAFMQMVRKNGRLTEARIGIKVGRKAGLRYSMGMVPIAWRLMRKNRLKLLHVERMPDPTPLRALLASKNPSAPTKGVVRT